MKLKLPQLLVLAILTALFALGGNKLWDILIRVLVSGFDTLQVSTMSLPGQYPEKITFSIISAILPTLIIVALLVAKPFKKRHYFIMPSAVVVSILFFLWTRFHFFWLQDDTASQMIVNGLTVQKNIAIDQLHISSFFSLGAIVGILSAIAYVQMSRFKLGYKQSFLHNATLKASQKRQSDNRGFSSSIDRGKRSVISRYGK
ncbi:hypothetical protein FUAX_51200 (plasmid) [Fulvitalea axinellae]|uniref:Uncharacterized protein n=1 Tax=Fulvitalea axinellae TaxID=1182444 RepID=A0AAU9CRA7_9BACT|nr:hypothetical protein FUAX_51200 [Fulvitalea axinellae]